MSEHSDAAREAARQRSGQFGAQENSAPEVDLPGTDDVLEEGEAMFVRAGASVALEAGREGGPFSFQFQYQRGLRDAWLATGQPSTATVLKTGRVRDEPSDVALKLDMGGQTVEVTLHREVILLFAPPRSE